MKHSDIGFLSQLEIIIHDRLEKRSEESYTARLAASGTKRIAQKVGEEGVEVALAAVVGNDDELINEAADLIYHLLILLADRGLTLNAVSDRLQTRHSS